MPLTQKEAKQLIQTLHLEHLQPWKIEEYIHSITEKPKKPIQPDALVSVSPFIMEGGRGLCSDKLYGRVTKNTEEACEVLVICGYIRPGEKITFKKDHNAIEVIEYGYYDENGNCRI